MKTSNDGLFIGLMSGTSVDGIDAALVEIQDCSVNSIAFAENSYGEPLRTALLKLNSDPRLSLTEYISLDHQIAASFADTALMLLAQTNYTPADVLAIGSHGQTVFHLPNGDPAGTLQLGDPNIIAFRTQIDTVADFRRADVARGGQGAPLVPAFHAHAFKTNHPRAILNLGGIANVTVLSTSGGGPIGFDTGPANTLLDAWTQQHTGMAFDTSGEWAASGHPDTLLLDALLSDPYFSIKPPKSTGTDYFSIEWLNTYLAQLNLTCLAPKDVQATLLELTTSSVAACIYDQCLPNTEVLLCGGGAHNRYLVEKLQEKLTETYSIGTTDDNGINGDFCEAIAFAWLAHRFKNSLHGNIPEATGASGHAILGGMYPASHNV